MSIKAIANNDIALVAWSVEQKIPSCLGFAVYRRDEQTQKEAPLPAWVGFAGESDGTHEARTTEKWPVQKFSWRDFTAKRGGTYSYRVVPMLGTPTDLKPHSEMELQSKPVRMTADRGDINVYFNRGILATQALTRALPKGPSGKPNPEVLRDRIDQPSDPLRLRLGGDAPRALALPLRHLKEKGGDCFAALYELNDTELVQLVINSDKLHLILSNTGADDATNQAARQALHDQGKDITDRMLKDGHIGHNKFVVTVDKKGRPRSVLTGSTNWTSTGLCAQSNNAIIIESTELARAYLNYYQRLKSDAAAQAPAFRTANQTSPVRVKVDKTKTSITVWFSPNTKQQSRPANNPPTPVDVAEAFQIIRGARQAVLFLAFIPGSPSIMDVVREVQLANPNLFVRGALTDQQAAAHYIDLYHRDGGMADARVIPAIGIPDQFGYWEAELYRLGHAVIHDKIVVVDPFSENCTVITGSHNLGFKASYSNDENMVIIRGSRAVAEAYTAHVLDVYDHYRWRNTVQQAYLKGRLGEAWAGLSKSDEWQDKYFRPDSPTRRDFAFWAGSD